jgi:hypothetical protein
MNVFNAKTVMQFLLISCFCSLSFSQEADVQNNNWLVDVGVKLERMRDEADADIRKSETAIEKCDSMIFKADDIASRARREGKEKAEKTAIAAATKAREAKKMNSTIKKAAERNRDDAEKILARLKNVLINSSTSRQEIVSAVTAFSGSVSVQKKSGETIDFNKDLIPMLEQGDTIVTGDKSSSALQCFDGRCILNMAANSRVKIEQDDADAQVVSLVQGEIDVSVEKLEEQAKRLEQEISASKASLERAADEYEKARFNALERALNTVRARIMKFGKKFEVRSSGGGGAVRGTRFISRLNQTGGMDLLVVEGCVEMKGTKEDKTVMVNAGYRCTASKDGILSEPRKVDLSNPEKWWEK